MEEKNCYLCLEETKNDAFFTRCGHKFHDSSIQKEVFSMRENKCPECSTILTESKSIEGILFKANESKNLNYNELVKLFDKIEKYKNQKHTNKKHSIGIGIKKSVLEEAINLGFDLNSFDYPVKELLQYICENDLTCKLNMLIDLGLKLDPSEDSGQHVWITAMKGESFGILGKMKELNFDPKKMKLISLKSLILTKWLIDNGLDVNSKIGDLSFIHLACDVKANTDLVKLLVLKGADINLKDNNGLSPFHRSVKVATAKSYYDEKFFRFLRELISLGADIESVDNDNSTPLYSALVNQNIDIVYFLLWNGADINSPKIKTLGPLLFYLLKCCKDKNTRETAVFQKFRAGVNYFPDINESDSNGQNCLHKVLIGDYGLDYIKLFVELGVNVNAQDSQGNTPLHILGSQLYLSREKLDFLMINGANMYLENNKGEKVLKFFLR